MDINIIFLLIIVIITIGLIFCVNYFRQNNKINDKTLETVATTLNLTVTIIDQLNLKNEDKIINLTNIIIESINYTKDVLNSKNNDELIFNAIVYAQKLCLDQGIELTDSRKAIIDSLVRLSINNGINNT
jgi:uncharacterized protein with FMN-binding domain